MVDKVKRAQEKDTPDRVGALMERNDTRSSGGESVKKGRVGGRKGGRVFGVIMSLVFRMLMRLSLPRHENNIRNNSGNDLTKRIT